MDGAVEHAVIDTARLRLRSFMPTDAERVAEMCGDFSVSRMCRVVPHPYTLSDAEFFVGSVCARKDCIIYAIEHEARVIGCVSLDDVMDAVDGGRSGTLGYWLGADCHRRGFASEAARALVAHAFTRGGFISIVSGYWAENSASARVQAKLGFRVVGYDRLHCAARRCELDSVVTELLAAEWGTLLAERSYLDPLADALQWDWRSLQRCVLVSSAWRAAMRPVKATLETRLTERLEELQKSCAERAATEQARLQATPHVLHGIAKVEVAEVMHFKCPPPVIIRVMSLVLHILGASKEHTDVSHLGAEYRFLAKGWLPPSGQPGRPGGDDYIFWNCVKNAWHTEQLDQLWREDAPTSVGRMRELSVASVPPERLEDLYQRREASYLLPDRAYAHGSPLAGKLAEWMQALVAGWSLVRARHPEAPTLLTLKHELLAAQQRAQEQRTAHGAAHARAEEERLASDHRLAEDNHAQSRDLVRDHVVDGQVEQLATHLRVS